MFLFVSFFFIILKCNGGLYLEKVIAAKYIPKLESHGMFCKVKLAVQFSICIVLTNKARIQEACKLRCNSTCNMPTEWCLFLYLKMVSWVLVHYNTNIIIISINDFWTTFTSLCCSLLWNTGTKQVVDSPHMLFRDKAITHFVQQELDTTLPFSIMFHTGTARTVEIRSHVSYRHLLKNSKKFIILLWAK